MKLKMLKYENDRLKRKRKKIEDAIIKNEKAIALETTKSKEFKELQKKFEDGESNADQ